MLTGEASGADATTEEDVVGPVLQLKTAAPTVDVPTAAMAVAVVDGGVVAHQPYAGVLAEGQIKAQLHATTTAAAVS